MTFSSQQQNVVIQDAAPTNTHRTPHTTKSFSSKLLNQHFESLTYLLEPLHNLPSLELPPIEHLQMDLTATQSQRQTIPYRNKPHTGHSS